MLSDAMARPSNKRCAGAGIVCLLALALVITSASGARKSGKEQKISILYALSAGSGTLAQKNGKGALYELTLKHLDRNVVWFSDRPARRSGAFPNRVLAEAWRGFGFAADPPNAALVYSDKSGQRGRTVIVELSHPRFAKGKLSFAARVLDPDGVKAPDLAAHAAAADRAPASELSEATLFIDDTQAPVKDTCVFQPATVCENANLRVPLGFEFDLYRADFSGTSFYKAIFSDSEFREANLRGAQLTESELDGDNFERADLTGANLTRTIIEPPRESGRETEFLYANLTDANLSIAFIFNAEFSYSTLQSINLENAELTAVELNSTLMREANFAAATLTHVNLNSTEMVGSNLRDATLNAIRLRSGNIADSTVTDAHLTNVDFTNSDVQDVDFSGSVLNEVDFREARIDGSIFAGASLCKVTMPEGAVVNSGC
jgi:uncharacterized protein YjbI with pentapeptide repeats